MPRITDTSGLTDADTADLLEIRENNAKQISGMFAPAIAKALEEIGLLAEGYAKKECPVDTGRLRNSITHAVVSRERSVYVGTNVEYGPYVELGTRKRAAKPFLRPAAENHGSQYRSILKGTLEEA